jgi:hypothetical protein
MHGHTVAACDFSMVAVVLLASMVANMVAKERWLVWWLVFNSMPLGGSSKVIPYGSCQQNGLRLD